MILWCYPILIMLCQFGAQDWWITFSNVCSNWGVRINAGLRKYDHVSSHQTRLRWLSVESQIKYHSLCAIHRQYSSHQCLLLDPPPIIFGSQHSYSTRSSDQFANICRCRLSRTQHFLVCNHYLVEQTSQWNDKVMFSV